MTTDKESNWVEAIGKPSLDGIREMVAALECDYERLEELRELKRSCVADLNEESVSAVEADERNESLWLTESPDEAEELAELEAAAKPCGNECKSRDDAEQMIHDDALSVEVRSGWVSSASEMEPEDFAILLSTGGPAVRIRGELADGEPHRAWLEVQDWGKPWTEYYESGAMGVLLTYSRCFCFESGR